MEEQDVCRPRGNSDSAILTILNHIWLMIRNEKANYKWNISSESLFDYLARHTELVHILLA